MRISKIFYTFAEYLKTQNTMTNREIIEKLRKSVGYSKEDMNFMGSISSTFHGSEYLYGAHYRQMRQVIESLPWISVKDRLPEDDSKCLTLLDCNEHEVDVQSIRLCGDGNRHWVWCDKHVCYWMPIPQDNDNEITYTPSKMDWHDGGQKMY